MATAVFISIAYLIGSLSFAVIVSRAFALPDPRSYGSGNPGATNVLRSGKKLAAFCTLIGDGGKGWLAVFLAARYAADYGVDATGVATCAVAVFLGHLFPLFFGFRGGKGVSAAGGILLAIHPWLGLATLATWIIVALFFRYSSLAAIVSAVFAPLYAFFMSLLGFTSSLGFELNSMLPATILVAALLVWRHKTNILNLVAGKEGRIGEKRTGETA
ncbi:MAG TPA: glycerol-3-phosphate 1-O-acyltransferase PlsY [Burkholderiales bacterium]|nr:glycerol-3-phosphate 1-O-acyltransferase PlsY [Burkholderiales bacterium]